ncbi:MAG: hypothetical protein COS65_14650, partial [Armatimonadetes bacterium CG06_land_8_20_14_3_00_66_21]
LAEVAEERLVLVEEQSEVGVFHGGGNSVVAAGGKSPVGTGREKESLGTVYGQLPGGQTM